MFANKVLKWFDSHGRKDLPWQENQTPYVVWLSEIMLQQTQVKTVIPYFKTFIKKFPTVKKLAKANIDDVLHLWTGLGYYSRARNLHKTAKIISNDYKGNFPNNLDELIALPGIGRSTAGAILSLAFKIPTPILDGNVKRVLIRYHAIDKWYGETETLKRLWKIATNYTPKNKADNYTQAMMDLGATVCTRTKPLCLQCPLTKTCISNKENLQTKLPVKKPKKTLPIRNTFFLILKNKNNAIFLEQRPPVGIWGGLWSFPECETESDIKSFAKKH